MSDVKAAVTIWAVAMVLVVGFRSCDTRKELTGVISADAYTEQCRHYHYGPDQTRTCMDKFRVK